MTAPSATAASDGRRWLRWTERPLIEVYDAGLVDLDGVIYVGAEPVRNAVPTVAAARQAGMSLTFVTNNASRSPAEVAAQLRALGLAVTPTEITTSAQAAAAILAGRLPANARVLVVGAPALRDAVTEAGLHPVASLADEPAAVVNGYSADLCYPQLAEAALAIRSGVPWVSTNLDPTLPTPRGPVPGNGSLTALLRTATDRAPEVAGKPEPALFTEAAHHVTADRPLVIGDRLDTDVAGARAAGFDSLLVLTGVTHPLDVAMAPAGQRPTFIAADLRGLLVSHPQVSIEAGVGRCGAFGARVRNDHVEIERMQTSAEDSPDGAIDALRAACMAAWASADAGHAPIRALVGLPAYVS
jgi:HAD superfamily hydrolase (TIGR01450 family)